MGRDLTCLWRSSSALGVGELTRFRIKFNLAKFLSHPTTTVKPFPLTVEVKNSTPLIYRGALLTGPYNISACVIPTRDLLTRNIYACLQLKPVLACGEIWRATLDLPKEGVGDWTADIFSEVLFSPNKVEYEISVLAELPEGDYNLRSDNDATSDYENTVSYTPAIEYVVWKTEDIFGLPDLSSRKIGDDVHLVVLTHGLNGSALDKKYLKERLDEKYNQQTGTRVVPYVADVNHASTWDGVEVCARRIADKLLQIAGWPWNENIQDRTDKEEISTKPYISKISLIGHSLGGLINVCLAGYLNSLTNGEFYRSIQAVNFITVATPWLGSTEQPWYIKAGMQAGAVGQTGKDLLAVQRTRSEQVQARGAAEENTLEEEPLLLALAHPSSPSHQALAKFQHRTVYANIVNDVSVSFRTASLYFVDFDPTPHVKVRSVNLLDHLQHIHNTLNPRVPPIETITKQRSAVNPILHDKLYTPDEISPPAGECAMPIEERIARLWHKDLTWRKVVVRLEGEAHLSVIVRREWLNKEGKQVIEHLLNEHEF